MKAKELIVWLSLLSLGVFGLSAEAAEVAQGKCIDFDTAGKRIILEEYNTEITRENPYGKSIGLVSVFDFSAAKVGIPPEPGDILRIAYTVESGVKRAIKVMNVSKQDLRKK